MARKDAGGFASWRLPIKQEMKVQSYFSVLNRTDRKRADLVITDIFNRRSQCSLVISCSQFMVIVRRLRVHVIQYNLYTSSTTGTELVGTATELWSFREANQSSVLVMCAQDLGKFPVLLPSVTSSPHKVALFSYQGLCTHSFQTQ